MPALDLTFGLDPNTNPEERHFFRNRVDSSTSRSQTFKVLVGNLFVTIFDVLRSVLGARGCGLENSNNGNTTTNKELGRWVTWHTTRPAKNRHSSDTDETTPPKSYSYWYTSGW